MEILTNPLIIIHRNSHKQTNEGTCQEAIFPPKATKDEHAILVQLAMVDTSGGATSTQAKKQRMQKGKRRQPRKRITTALSSYRSVDIPGAWETLLPGMPLRLWNFFFFADKWTSFGTLLDGANFSLDGAFSQKSNFSSLMISANKSTIRNELYQATFKSNEHNLQTTPIQLCKTNIPQIQVSLDNTAVL